MAKAGPRQATATGEQRQRSADVRAALITSAIDALRETGYAGASAREIAGRAGCSQGLVFYHFGSVTGLLLAALDEVSSLRMAAYRGVLDQAASVSALVESAREIFLADLEAGYVRVLTEMITAAHSVDGLGPQVAERLAPWREFAEAAAGQAFGRSPLGKLLPPAEVGHAVVAGFLGLEMLAGLDGDRAAALALFDRARSLARVLDVTGGRLLPGRKGDTKS
jgi:AcrR family transcriptional regulator